MGLSGLITPSLDEMVHVAEELEREGFDVPLLIGGATTSTAHTAVRVEGRYRGATVHVLDASRAVGVVSKLLSSRERAGFVARTREEYSQVRERHEGRREKRELLPIAEARANPFPVDWGSQRPTKPRSTGLQVVLDQPISELVRYIDWTPFFQAWELKGKYPDILTDPDRGVAATELFEDAEELLGQIVRDHLFRAKGAFGIWPAQSEKDDVVLYQGEERVSELARIHTVRQQFAKSGDRANIALADFVAPRDQGVLDWAGAFVVTAGLGVDELVARFEREHDDYRAILARSLADRLVEAFAEQLHQRVRREFWGYSSDEDLAGEYLIAERYQGIRPAPGYPACPDHTEKGTLSRILDAESLGVHLTESYAMTPPATVSGWYLAHPEAFYFGVGRLGEDQVADYANRKGWVLEEAERWLRPNLSYEPERDPVSASTGPKRPVRE